MKKSLYGFMFLFFLIRETWAMWEGEDPEDNPLGRTTSKQNNKIEKETILEESAEENKILHSETEALAVLREKKESFLTLAKNEIKMVKTRNPYYNSNRHVYYNYRPCFNPYMEVETKGVN
ncbi:MAG: hypothetical protein JNJ47_04510 [Alphaproteobacteria bacterium]|nr:hypothetical protein [Alphaproteobacteria bacterium]